MKNESISIAVHSVGAIIRVGPERFLFQLRDDKPGVVMPGYWGLFGGHIEGDVVNETISIDNGAYIDGAIRRSDDPLAEAAAHYEPSYDTPPNEPQFGVHDRSAGAFHESANLESERLRVEVHRSTDILHCNQRRYGRVFFPVQRIDFLRRRFPGCRLLRRFCRLLCSLCF